MNFCKKIDFDNKIIDVIFVTCKTILNVHVGVSFMYIKDGLKRTCWSPFNVH